MNIDLHEVCDARLEHLDVRESYGDIVCQRYPQLAALLCVLQIRLAGRLGENRRRCVASEECGGGELDGGQQRKIARSCRSDLVHGITHYSV
jgi:hypothetical protein